MTDIFSLTTRPNNDLFFKKNDPNDPRLGEVVTSNPDDYAQADIVIIGCPQDQGVARNGGRVGAKDAPDAIRRCFYKLANFNENAPKIFDLGNTITGTDTLEDIHERHQLVMTQLLNDGKTVFSLGGGNDISYPDVVAMADTNENFSGFNIDAHFDVRADQPRNSGTPYRQLLEEGHLKPQKFYEVAFQPFANSQTYLNYLREKGVKAFSIDVVRNRGLIPTLQTLLDDILSTAGIFWGLDMDVVRAADAPGVSAINPDGLTSTEFKRIAYHAGYDPRSRIFEITEVNPTYDIDGRTCRLASIALYNFVLGRMDI